jgi:osmotically inducible protein OsmC
MANAERKARVVWEGDLLNGNGALTAESSGVLQDTPVTWASRTANPEGKTSPEELIAAAHAACYAMVLSLTLANNGNDPGTLQVEAVCTFDDEAAKVTTSELYVSGEVPGLDAAGFEEIAKQAEPHCPVSNALRNNVDIRLHVNA